MNHVLAEGEQADGLEAPRFSLDELLAGDQPVLLKIDVEGYEHAVLQGAQNTLSSSTLQGVIVEANGSERRYGYADQDVFNLLERHGFKQCRYDPFNRALKAEAGNGCSTVNALFLKDLGVARQRVESAPAVTVLGQTL
jgi:hypothetical protein